MSLPMATNYFLPISFNIVFILDSTYEMSRHLTGKVLIFSVLPFQYCQFQWNTFTDNQELQMSKA